MQQYWMTRQLPSEKWHLWRHLLPRNTDFTQFCERPEILNGAKRKGVLTPASKYEPPHKLLVGNKGQQQQGLQVDPFDKKPEEIGQNTKLEECHSSLTSNLEVQKKKNLLGLLSLCLVSLEMYAKFNVTVQEWRNNKISVGLGFHNLNWLQIFEREILGFSYRLNSLLVEIIRASLESTDLKY